MSKIQSFDFSQIQPIQHDGNLWLTAEQLGSALGYKRDKARISVSTLYNRHSEEFSDADSTVIKLITVDGKLREQRIFSHSGCNLLSFFANTPMAKSFRAWAKVELTKAKMSQTQAASDWLIDELQDEYCKANPRMLNLIQYFNKGLKVWEMAKLLECDRSTVRVHLKKLTRLGFIDYVPDPELSARGKKGYAMLQAKRAFEARQITFNLVEA